MKEEAASRCACVRRLAVKLLVAADQEDMPELLDVAGELELLFAAMKLDWKADHDLQPARATVKKTDLW